MLTQHPSDVAHDLQERLIAFVRAFGLHQPDRTPCGQPVGVAGAYALMELQPGAPLSQGELARRLRLEKSTVSRLVAGLERRGWVTRERAGHDGRWRLLRLTASGSEAAVQLAIARGDRFTRLVEALPEADRARVLDALTALGRAAGYGGEHPCTSD